ncbi:protein Cep78 homolog [Harpegnathos saltator]|uniref:protein Cep78 homolog n=1 Tax=Harpegnathos saltator TaxID=610380 RepID=UPI000DBEEB95|nr:protein Cep78 homolog [Harpegnathos saltator]
MAADETVHNSGGTTTGTITTLEGKVPSRRRRKIDAAAPAPPQKMAIPAGRNFASCYMELCKQQRLRPLPVICVTLPHSLDFTTDRVKMDDWGPILNSLSLDRSLRSISVHSRYQCRKPLEEVNSEDKARAMGGKAPVVLTRYLLEWLSQSVGQCMRNSSSLTHLELEGIPFPADCVAVLSVGLSSTQTLLHLSLRRCYIGDDGCELICRTIADARSLRSLNLSYCDLTSSSGGVLASALSRQKLALYHDTWKQSLRYREPNLEAMRGLRRLTLNDNPQLGNCAVRQLIDAIRESLWLKALDLQHCGLTDQIGPDLLELLSHNDTLTVLDVRRNINLNESLAMEVMRRLEENDAEGKSEYRWLRLQTKDQRTAASSATAAPRGENEQAGNRAACQLLVERKTSLFAKTRPARRPSQVIHPRRTAPAPTKMKKTRAQSPPVRDTTCSQRDNLQPQMLDAVRLMPKVSLHLDLQSRIQPEVDPSNHDIPMENRSGLENVSRGSGKASLVSLDSTKVDVATQSVDLQDDSNEMKNILRQLTEVQAEYDRLMEETKRVDLLLLKEQSRRETAETNLRSVQSNMAELEDALQRNYETKGFLLVSQQSFDEICLSFNRLFDMLENVGTDLTARTQDSRKRAQADIRRRLASVIRQTKSENLKRVCKEKLESSRYNVDSGRKFAKSESDVRSSLPIPAVQLERKIGESPDEENAARRRRHGNAAATCDKPMSSVERARAIFASIVNGDSVLDCY